MQTQEISLKKLVGSSLKSPVLVTMYVFNFNIYKPASIAIRKPYFLEPSITREPLKDLKNKKL